jgi:hypothetical protein
MDDRRDYLLSRIRGAFSIFRSYLILRDGDTSMLEENLDERSNSGYSKKCDYHEEDSRWNRKARFHGRMFPALLQHEYQITPELGRIIQQKPETKPTTLVLSCIPPDY